MNITKTSSAGTTLVSFPGVAGSNVAGWFNYRRQNGTTSSFAGKPSVHSVNRKAGRDSTITYGTKKQGFNPCSHVQKLWIPTGSPGLAVITNSRPDTTPVFPTTVVYGVNPYSTLHYYTRYYGEFLTVASNASAPSSFDWGAWGATALQHMLPSLRADMSLPNFIIELRDMRFVWKALTGKYPTFYTFIRKLAGAAYGQRVGQKPMSRLANGVLANEFAWRPFASDVISLVSSMQNLLGRLNDVMERANSPQQRYYGTWVPGTSQTAATTNIHTGISPAAAGSTGSLGSLLGDTHVLAAATDGLRYHATMRYNYPVPSELRSASGRLKAGLDSLGVSGNPAIIWNAIPFTFVVDWFVKVGQYLERFDQKNVRFQTQITDFCHSVRYQRQYKYQLRAPNRLLNGSLSTSAYVTMDECVVRKYERRVGIPNLAQGILTSGLNIREFLLGGFLLYNGGSKRYGPR